MIPPFRQGPHFVEDHLLGDEFLFPLPRRLRSPSYSSSSSERGLGGKAGVLQVLAEAAGDGGVDRLGLRPGAPILPPVVVVPPSAFVRAQL